MVRRVRGEPRRDASHGRAEQHRMRNAKEGPARAMRVHARARAHACWSPERAKECGTCLLVFRLCVRARVSGGEGQDRVRKSGNYYEYLVED